MTQLDKRTLVLSQGEPRVSSMVPCYTLRKKEIINLYQNLGIWVITSSFVYTVYHSLGKNIPLPTSIFRTHCRKIKTKPTSITELMPKEEKLHPVHIQKKSTNNHLSEVLPSRGRGVDLSLM